MKACDFIWRHLAKDAGVRPPHVFMTWHAMKEKGAAFNPAAFAKFAGLELRHVEAIMKVIADSELSVPQRSVSVRGSRLPDDWEIPQDWIEWASRKRKWHPDAVKLQAERFANHWQSKTGKDATKLNWLKTWQNWVIGSHTPDGDYNPNRSSNPAERADFLRKAIANYERMGRGSETWVWQKELEALGASNVINLDDRRSA